MKSSIHWRKLNINIANTAEKLNFEIFNDVIHAYRKYFRKSCLHTKCVEFDYVLPAKTSASIALTVFRLFAFKAIYDVIFIKRE